MSNYKNPYEAIGIVMECHAKGCVSVAQNCLSLEMGVFDLSTSLVFVTGLVSSDRTILWDHRILGYC